jgi:hypothetical protein
VPDGGKTLLNRITFDGAERKYGRCRSEGDIFACTAIYAFAAEPKVVRVRSDLHSATTANHVHVLRARKGDRADQAVLDMSFSSAELRFQPPGPMERAVEAFMAGAARAFGWAQVIFLAALALAMSAERAASRAALFLAAAFLAGQGAAAIILPLTAWHPAPRFVEAAAALSIAYLTAELVIAPLGGHRWVVVAILGLIHGLYFGIFLQTTGMPAIYVVTGASVTEAAVLGAMWIPVSRLSRIRVPAAVLSAGGLAWFLVRLAG